MHFNLLIKKNDPIIIFDLPADLVKHLQLAAKKTRRKLSNEIIIRLSRTFEHSAQYQLIEPLVKLDFLGRQEYTLSSFKVLKSEGLQKAIHSQLKALRLHFSKKVGFVRCEQPFPQELWHAVQADPLNSEQSLDEILAFRLKATLEEPALFRLPSMQMES